ncbi:hypothetical protein FRC00_009034 [Tulasnella sp. 408]|nr:hypothetical protein FRC00_009034 [Tulasnella sp. 408]
MAADDAVKDNAANTKPSSSNDGTFQHPASNEPQHRKEDLILPGLPDDDEAHERRFDDLEGASGLMMQK